MAWSVDQTELGSNSAAGASTTQTMTTAAAAASNTWIFAYVSFWTNTGGTLTTFDGGGLTWEKVVEKLHTGAATYVALYRAWAPSGLASSSTLTATYSTGVYNRGIGASSFAGGASDSAIQNTATNQGDAGGAYTVDVTAVATTDLEIAALNCNNTSSGNTPDANTTELIDDGDGSGPEQQVLMYRLAGVTGSVVLGGTLGGSGNTLAIVGAAFAAGGVAAAVRPLQVVAAPRMR